MKLYAFHYIIYLILQLSGLLVCLLILIGFNFVYLISFLNGSVIFSNSFAKIHKTNYNRTIFNCSELHMMNKFTFLYTVKPASNGTCMNRKTVHTGKFSWSHELQHNININLPGYRRTWLTQIRKDIL